MVESAVVPFAPVSLEVELELLPWNGFHQCPPPEVPLAVPFDLAVPLGALPACPPEECPEDPPETCDPPPPLPPPCEPPPPPPPPCCANVGKGVKASTAASANPLKILGDANQDPERESRCPLVSICSRIKGMNFILPSSTRLLDGRVFRSILITTLVHWTCPRTHKLHDSPSSVTQPRDAPQSSAYFLRSPTPAQTRSPISATINQR